MLYLASGVLCVDSSENQLEEFGNFQKDCGFIRKYAGLLQIHNILENPQISNMNSDFVPQYDYERKGRKNFTDSGIYDP